MRNVLIGLTLFVISPLVSAADLQFGQGPIQPSAKQAALAGAPEGTLVQLDAAGLAAFEEGSLVWLPGNAGKAMPARVTRVLAREDGSLDWSARVPGGQTATIVVRQGHAFGWIPQPKGAALRLETRHGQSRIVEEKSSLRPAGPDVLLPPEPTPAQRAARKRQESVKAEGTPRLDVLVAYQPSLVDVWGSVAAVQARIAYLETITNQAYVDTGMDLEIRVVATHLLDFAATADNVDALYAITDPSSLEVKQEIDRVRAMYGADLVKLMRNFDRVNQTSCGVGWLGGYHGNPFIPEYGFSVTADLGFGGDGCGEWTFAHEIGHNQGAHHDIETTGGDYGAFEYSRGHRQTVSADSGFATIMAYNTGPQQRLGRFSDPDLLECLGQPCGIAEEADNARGIVETAAMVAGMVPEVSAGALPLLSLDDVQITEGNSGQRPVRFTLSLSAPAAGPVTVYLATRAGSATNTDFAPRTYNILIPAGQTAVTIDVGVRGDTLMEPDEVFSLDILSVSGAGVAKGQGVATIVSDDAIPTLTLADVSVQEPSTDEGARDAVLTATLSHPSNQSVRFDIETGQYGGANAATASRDFVYARQRGVEIPAGATSVQFSVSVLGDFNEEQDERFYVAIGGLSGARLDDSIIQVTIKDNVWWTAPPQPQMSVESFSVQEGSQGIWEVPVRVSLQQAATQDVQFALLAAGDTATAGSDFDATGLAGQVIPAGQTEVQVALRIVGDTLDEADETLLLRLGNVIGASPAAAPARVTLLDDDGSSQTSPHVARDDRVVMVENGAPVRIAVLANDVFDAARLQGGSLVVTEPPVYGSVQRDTNGTSGTAADDTLVYVPPVDASVEDALAYRLCDASGRCSEALVHVLVRPALDVQVDSPTGSGFMDVGLDGLRAMPALRVLGYGWASTRGEVVSLAIDSTPESPWDGQGTHETYTRIDFPFTPGDSYQPYRDYRVIADVQGLQGRDVDVYLGVDDNGNRRADPGETRCTAAMGTPVERCEMDLRVPVSGSAGYWLLVHNREAVAAEARVEDFTIQVGREDPYGYFMATGPGRLAAGEAFAARMAWHMPWAPQGEAMVGLVGLQDRNSGEVAYFPARIDRTQGGPGPEAVQFELDYGIERQIPAGSADELLFIDLPAGVTGLDLGIAGSGPLDVHLARAVPDNTDARIGPAPPRADAAHQFLGVGSETISLDAADLDPGRWYVTLTNNTGQVSSVFMTATVQADSLPLAPGSYFNSGRSGHGLFIYPAGGELAGLWYTYLQDGSPTWYYLQGWQPGTSGQWHSSLYRASWNGLSNVLNLVGKATATVQEDGLVFTYRLDGEVGSEKLVALGQGCPTLSGQPLDASSHWFDPAKAGTGYSVQLFPNYEFYAAFVYDSRGVPRFLTSEAGSFRGADATLPLEQLTGFCPLCTRTGAPTRADVGTLRRRFDATGLVQMQLDAIYTGGVPGAWTGNDMVQALGGAGTTQGCLAP